MAHTELFYPTKEEFNVLKQHEPFIAFEVLPPLGISEGRQSRVSIMEYTVEGVRKRVIWKRMGVGKGLTEEEAQGFESRLRPYRQELIRYGWRVPETFFTRVIPVSGEFQIFSYEQYIPGGDSENMVINISEPNFKKWFVLRKIVETLAAYSLEAVKKQILCGEEIFLLPHGLDLKLANFVLDSDGELFFVDLFGTKELDTNGNWRTYSRKLDSLSEEKLKAICATREGAILRFYRLMEKKWVEIGGIKVIELRRQFIELLDRSSLPAGEVGFIKQEIEGDFPWLVSIYQEADI